MARSTGDSSGRRRSWRIGLLCILLLLSSASPVAAQVGEEEIKAVLLERFSRFITWPERPGDAMDEAFLIGVVGETPLIGVLRETYRKRTILDRPVKIVVMGGEDAPDSCDLLYIADVDPTGLTGLLDRAAAHGVLTVADSPGFGERGVMINFYREQKRIRFEINETAVEAAGIGMSYMLLKTARIIAPAGGTS